MKSTGYGSRTAFGNDPEIDGIWVWRPNCLWKMCLSKGRRTRRGRRRRPKYRIEGPGRGGSALRNAPPKTRYEHLQRKPLWRRTRRFPPWKVVPRLRCVRRRCPLWSRKDHLQRRGVRHRHPVVQLSRAPRSAELFVRIEPQSFLHIFILEAAESAPSICPAWATLGNFMVLWKRSYETPKFCVFEIGV